MCRSWLSPTENHRVSRYLRVTAQLCGSVLTASSWRVPIAINLVWVVLLVLALFVIPESREWPYRISVLTDV